MNRPRGLNPVRHVLPNGLTVIVKQNRTIPAVSIVVGIRGGGYCDPIDAEGTAALVARVLDRGTTTRSADAIADDLDGRGASLSVSASRHTISVSATCLADDFDAVLGVVADVVVDPAFPERAVETRRAELITSIKEAEDDPASMAVDALMQALYAGHPYARQVRGSAASVDSLRRGHLAAFHAAWFNPPATTVVIVGDVTPESAAVAAERWFGAWRGAPTPLPIVPDAPSATRRTISAVPMMNKAQADVAYGFCGIRRADPDYFAAAVMNNVLGQYALGGRLGDSIRERQGMAYYVFSSLDAGMGPGPLMIRAGVSAANVDTTIKSVDAELDGILGEGFTTKEVDESKQYLVGSLPRQLETNAAIASFLLSAELLGLGTDLDVRLPALIGAVSHAAVNAVATRLLAPARATIVVAGPWQATPGK